MTKYLMAALAAGALIVGTAFAAGVPGGDEDPVNVTPSAVTTTTEQPVDISGPCDEAEHANDPECQGVVDDDDNSGPGDGDDDNSGPGGGDDDHDDDGDERDDRFGK